MKNRLIHSVNLLFLSTTLVGCTRFQLSNNQNVLCIIEDKINSQAEWYEDEWHQELMHDCIQNLLNQELTPDSAIQIALLNNPKIQAFFAELGISNADLIEAGLLSNPAFSLDVRYPNSQTLHTNIEYLITSSLIDIFLLPLRTKLAAIEYEKTKFIVANKILNLAFEVRQTFYQLIAEIQKTSYLKDLIELADIHNEITRKQKGAGNIDILSDQRTQLDVLEVKLELSQSELTIIQLKEKLNRLLGLQDDVCLNFPEKLPAFNCLEIDLCQLESIALQERLDVAVAQYEIMLTCQKLGLKEWWVYTDLSVGLSGERETDGTNVLGPGITGEVPIFNYGQAARLRLQYELQQAQEELKALEIQVLSEVREAYQKLTSYCCILNDYQNRIFPLQKDILQTSESLYNIMGLGIDQLIEGKKKELKLQQSYIEYLKGFWMTKVDLDRALGGDLFPLINQECAQVGDIHE